MTGRRAPRAAAGTLAAVLAALAVPGCSDDGTTAPAPSDEVGLALTGLSPVAEGEGALELWISFALPRSPGGLRHSAAASAGRFRIDNSGAIVGPSGGPMVFQVLPGAANVPLTDGGEVAWQLAVDAFVTMEPAADADLPGPNLPGIVGGTFLNGTCILGTLYADALNVDLSSATGSFHLATPTTAAADDEFEGVWFAAPGGGAPSLDALPPPPPGWIYEGWLSLGVFGAVSLGRFTSATGADLDGAGPTPGPLPGYAFPGSDFPTASSGVDLRPGNVFVTLEPPGEADGATRPSFLTVLAGQLTAAQPVGVAAPLANVFPALGGTVTIPLDP